MRLTIIIILVILAGFAAGTTKELFPVLHDVPTQAIIILTAFVVGIIILLFQRARGTLHDDHWAKDQFKNKEDKERPAPPERSQSQSRDDGPPGEAEALAKIKHLCWMAGMSAESVALDKKSGKPPENWGEYEHSRYQRLRDEALQLADKLTDEFYRSTAVHFLVEICMKADDVDGARALFAQCEVDFIREKIVEQYPELDRPAVSSIVRR